MRVALICRVGQFAGELGARCMRKLPVHPFADEASYRKLTRPRLIPMLVDVL